MLFLIKSDKNQTNKQIEMKVWLKAGDIMTDHKRRKTTTKKKKMKRSHKSEISKSCN